MDKLIIEYDTFIITEFDESMVESVRKNSLDEDNRRFVPDEVFETTEEASAIIQQIFEWYRKEKTPLIYAVVLKTGGKKASRAICSSTLRRQSIS